jgi:hypothetical protein
VSTLHRIVGVASVGLIAAAAFSASPALADGRRVRVLWNYAGVNDRWKLAGEPNDGTSDTFQLAALIDERFRSICFGIFKAGPNSPIRYTTRP